MLNQVNLIGNLTRDPELKTTPNGKSVATFSIATSLKTKEQEYTEFHNIVAWGKLAEICGQYLQKGKQVYIGGRLQTRSWEKDGIKRYTTEIIADDMKMLGRKDENKPQNSQAPVDPSEAPIDDIRVENIPF